MRCKSKRYRHYNERYKAVIRKRVSIKERERGRRSGDWQSDLLRCYKKSSAINVCVERASRYTKISYLDKKSYYENRDALIKMLITENCKSITYDNGLENMLHEEVNSALKCRSYFCDPYHSWEKGTVEKRKGVIRRYMAKGRDFKNVREEDLRAVERSINNTPKKCLGWLSPQEVHRGGDRKDIMELAANIIHPRVIQSKILKVPLTT